MVAKDIQDDCQQDESPRYYERAKEVASDSYNPKEEGESRIAKYLSRAGVCSRREAERFIEEGKVQLNDITITSAVHFVSDKDRIIVNGKQVRGVEGSKLWLYHKKKGTVVSRNDEKDRDTIFSSLPADLGYLIAVGRLDYNTEGLLLLTNNGGLSRYICHPDQAWKRVYRVRVYGVLNLKKLKELEKGITIEGIYYNKIEIVVDKEGIYSWLQVTIYEGKNREIRKVMKYLGLEVTRLLRISFGPFDLEKLEAGDLMKVNRHKLSKVFPKEILES